MSTKHYWFIFHQGNLLLKKESGRYQIPLSQEPPVNPGSGMIHNVGKSGQYVCMAFAVKAKPRVSKTYAWVDLRSSFNLLDEKLFWLAGRAAQLINWDASSKFCPACGKKTKLLTANAKLCPQCAKEIYPTIATAAMVLIERGDELLMVRGVNFKHKFYGLVAGFVEAGETLEACVKREVLEETNLKVKNLRYFISRPWPFPSGLMVGFFADYAGGKLKLDPKEISAAEFFHKDHLPPMPSKLSLARKMVEAWLKSKRKECK